MQITKHGSLSPRINGNIKYHCQCGCCTTFDDRKDTEYVAYLTNVCSELHKTTSVHADSVQVTCPECHQTRTVSLNELRGRRSRSYHWGRILKILSILNILPLINPSLIDHVLFGTVLSLSIIISVTMFIMGKFICDDHSETWFDIK